MLGNIYAIHNVNIMLFWLICAMLTAAVTVTTVRPMLSRASATHPDDEDLRVYTEQLGEIDRDVARGLLTSEEAKSARIEISRRILAARPVAATADKRAAAVEPVAGHGESAAKPAANAMIYAVAAVIAFGSLGLYLRQGAPGYPSKPFAERAAQSPERAGVGELVARVEARLREAPDDGRGWDVLAPVYLKQQRNEEAIRAFGRAIELLGESRERLRGLAEAYLAASNGIVGKEVREAFTKILAKEPQLIAPRFWLAVGLEQDGDRAGAAVAYRALLESATAAGQPELPPALHQLIRERLAAVTGTAPPPKQVPDADAAAGKGPPPPAGMAEGMSAGQQAEMIEQMVSGLAKRLQSDGGSPEEWQRLIRAYWVMGRKPEAAAALTKAKAQFGSNADTARQLDNFAKTLGMPSG